MTKVYFYPKIKLKPNDTQNSYAKDFESALSVHHEVLNKTENSKGVLDFFKYLGKVDVFVFNWIEDIPRRRFGKLQILFFMLFLLLKRVFHNKIVWVLHNKYSHNLAKNHWTDLMFSLLMKNSDLILTHSNEGIEFVEKNYPKNVNKVKYEVHPIKQKLTNTASEKKHDFLFWGAIHPYKNIVEFLEFIKGHMGNTPKKILIVGFCSNETYRKELISKLDKDMTFENKFFEMNEIANFAAQSKYTLFTYKADSILSSGSLMDTIRMDTEIIGPNHGAFKDLEYLPSVHVYDTFEDIIDIHKNGAKPNETNKNAQELKIFFEENSWAKFAVKIQTHIKELLVPN